MEKKENLKIEISARTIIFTILLLIVLKLIWLIRDVIFSLFIAFIIMSALRPYVTFLIRKNFPRFLSAFLVYLVFLILFLASFILILPPLVSETTLLFKTLPAILDRFAPTLTSLFNLNSVFQYLPNLAGQFFNIVNSIFSNAIFVITTLFFAFYLLLQENVVKKMVSRFLPNTKGRTVMSIFERAEKRLNNWFWGEITLMTVVGLMTFVGLNLIGIRYSLALAVLAGLMEAVPNLGPTISSIPAIILGFSNSPVLGFAALALYFIVQQLENNLVVPLVMRRAVGLNPIITLIALLVGGRLGGILGVLLAIPITVFLETMLIEILNSKKTAVKSQE